MIDHLLMLLFASQQQRLSLQQLIILVAIGEGATYGLEISQRTGITSGSLYPSIDALERRGFLHSRFENIDEPTAGRRARRLLMLSNKGYELLAPLDIERRSAPSGW